MHINVDVRIKKLSKIFLISVIVKLFMTIFCKSKRIYSKISDRIKNMFNSFILQTIIFINIIIYHVLKKYKNGAYIIKKFENEFIINE